jgi:hypothetical protein
VQRLFACKANATFNRKYFRFLLYVQHFRDASIIEAQIMRNMRNKVLRVKLPHA